MAYKAGGGAVVGLKTLVVAVLLICAAVLAYWTHGARGRAEAAINKTQRPANTTSNKGPSGPMTEARFWALIDKTAAYEEDPDKQLEVLRTLLGRQSASEIEGFEHMFDRTMKQSYSWDLWGAAYVINGGASDDGFEYFRCWLISKGEAAFKQALAAPDSLADLLADDLQSGLDFEEFAYVAREVWAEKTGRDQDEMPDAANMIYPDRQPAGTPFAEDPAALAQRYPKLWRRFGLTPLG